MKSLPKLRFFLLTGLAPFLCSLLICGPLWALPLEGNDLLTSFLHPKGDGSDLSHCSVESLQTPFMSNLLSSNPALRCDKESGKEEFCSCMKKNLPKLSESESAPLERGLMKALKVHEATIWKDDIKEWNHVKTWLTVIQGDKSESSKASCDATAWKNDELKPCNAGEVDHLKSRYFPVPFKDFDKEFEDPKVVLEGTFSINLPNKKKADASFSDGIRQMDNLSNQVLVSVIEKIRELQEQGKKIENLGDAEVLGKLDPKTREDISKVMENHLIFKWINKGTVVDEYEEKTPSPLMTFFHKVEKAGFLKGGTFTPEKMGQFFNHMAPEMLKNDCSELKNYFIRMCKSFAQTPAETVPKLTAGTLKEARDSWVKYMMEQAEKGHSGMTPDEISQEGMRMKIQVDQYYCQFSSAGKEGHKLSDFEKMMKGTSLRKMGRKMSDQERLTNSFGMNNPDGQIPVGKDGKVDFSKMGLADSQGMPSPAPSDKSNPAPQSSSSVARNQTIQDVAPPQSSSPSGGNASSVPSAPMQDPGRGRAAAGPDQGLNGGMGGFNDSQVAKNFPNAPVSPSSGLGGANGEVDKLKKQVEDLQNQVNQQNGSGSKANPGPSTEQIKISELEKKLKESQEREEAAKKKALAEAQARSQSAATGPVSNPPISSGGGRVASVSSVSPASSSGGGGGGGFSSSGGGDSGPDRGPSLSSESGKGKEVKEKEVVLDEKSQLLLKQALADKNPIEMESGRYDQLKEACAKSANVDTCILEKIVDTGVDKEKPYFVLDKGGEKVTMVFVNGKWIEHKPQTEDKGKDKGKGEKVAQKDPNAKDKTTGVEGQERRVQEYRVNDMEALLNGVQEDEASKKAQKK